MKRLLSSIVLVLGFSSTAHAVTYGFDCITNNDPTDCGYGEAQLTMDVTSVSATQVQFKFSNAGSQLSSITQIYWDIGSAPNALASISSVTDSGDGVDFSTAQLPTNLGNLPGGNTIYFLEAVQATANPAVQPNGINPNEWLAVVFNLASGSSFDALIQELNDPLVTGEIVPDPSKPNKTETVVTSSTLRVGIHVQGFASGGSESFVNIPGDDDDDNTGGDDDDDNTVPEPGSLALFGAGLLAAGLGGLRRRRR